MKIKSLALIYLCFFNFIIFSQTELDEKKFGHPILSFNYSLNQPIFNWKERYGIFNSIGGQMGYKTKRNWLFQIEGSFIFGNKIIESNILDNLKDSYGNITDDQGNIATTPLFSRGYTSSLLIGKLFTFGNKEIENGLLINFGLGFLSYKYRIETNSVNIPQIENDYLKGYDRLTSGILLSQFLGYQYVSTKSLYNFYVGAYFQQGLTKNQRSIFFDQPNELVSNKIRFDGSYGLKLGWNIPFFNDKPKDFYYY